MFYSNLQFKNELISTKNDFISIVNSLNNSHINEKKKIQSDLRISLILKITGIMENWFDDVIYEYAICNSSPIFHKFFHASFTGKGKGVKPDRINGLLKILGVKPIKKDNNKSYTVVEDLYKLRDQVAHGGLSFVNTIESIYNNIDDVIKYMELVIVQLDNSLIKTVEEK